MTTNGLSLKHQSDTLVANIRGRHARDVTILKPPRVGATGRMRVTLAGGSLGARLGWEPGPLSVELDAPWVVLRPDVSSRARRSNDGRCAYLVAGARSGVMKGHGRW